MQLAVVITKIGPPSVKENVWYRELGLYFKSVCAYYLPVWSSISETYLAIWWSLRVGSIPRFEPNPART